MLGLSFHQEIRKSIYYAMTIVELLVFSMILYEKIMINGRENRQNSQTWFTARVFVNPGARPQTSFQLKLLLKESS
jgi:hypothetical protein